MVGFKVRHPRVVINKLSPFPFHLSRKNPLEPLAAISILPHQTLSFVTGPLLM